MRIFDQFWYKLGSLMLATVFWFFLVTFQNVIMDLSTPLSIEVRNKPEGFEMPYVLPEVTLKVAVPRDEVATLRKEDFSVYVDLQNVSEEEEYLDVHVEPHRANVRVIGYNPEVVAVKLEERQTKSLLISGEVSGVPAEGFEYLQPISYPSEAVVSGPRSVIERVDALTYKVTLENENKTVRKSVTLIAVDKSGKQIEKGVTISPPTIEAQVRVMEKEQEVVDDGDVSVPDEQ